MEATVKSAPATAGSIKRTQTEKKGLDIWFNKQALKFEEARFGWMTAYITIQSCLGSVAAGLILQNHASDIMLVIAAMTTMACNSVFIAQGPAKWCLSSFYLSVLINLILVLLNL